MARIEANGLGFEVADEGAGTPVVLLHGFPDTSVMWRHQVAALTAAGFRTIAPDMRGRGRSDRPPEVADYALTKIVGDVIGIMDALGVQKAHVVGHDWGAAVAWGVAMFAPHRVDHLPRLLRAVRGVEVRERLAVDELLEDGEVGTQCARVELRLARRYRHETMVRISARGTRRRCSRALTPSPCLPGRSPFRLNSRGSSGRRS